MGFRWLLIILIIGRDSGSYSAMRDDLEMEEEVAGSIPFPSYLLSHITCYMMLRDTVNTVAYYIGDSLYREYRTRV